MNSNLLRSQRVLDRSKKSRKNLPKLIRSLPLNKANRRRRPNSLKVTMNRKKISQRSRKRASVVENPSDDDV
jgi:hypothetical protein